MANKTWIYLGIGALVVIGTIVTLALLPKGSSQKNNPIISKVGQENIYQSDLEYELRYYPPIKMEKSDLHKLLITKIATDSAILQGAQEENIVPVSYEIYNSPNKNYDTRLATVKMITEKIKQKSSKVSGAILTVWFYNNEVGPLGYEASKTLANKKINQIYEDVKSGKKTITKAAEEQKTDPDMKLLDPTAYKYNTLLEFADVPYDKKITLDATFDEIIRKTQANNYTPVTALKGLGAEKETEIKEVLYAFALVYSNTSGSNTVSLDQWINQKTKKYELTYNN